MIKVFRTILLSLSIYCSICFSYENEDFNFDLEHDDTFLGTLSHQTAIAIHGVNHGVLSITITTIFIGATIYIFGIEFDPFKGKNIKLKKVAAINIIGPVIEEFMLSFFVNPAVIFFINFSSNNILSLNVDGEDIKTIADLLSCIIFGSLHYLAVPNPSILHVASITMYSLSVLSIKEDKGFMAGAVSHIVFNLIGFQMLYTLRLLRST